MKVAAYCRVSTEKEDQVNSFENQQRYFREYSKRQPGWELAELYADEGITGTNTKKRAAFHQMIHDAHMGKFQLLLTKEVSRFSRNILDTIRFTRELKALGVGVLFLNDGISTLDPDAELRLSIMASIAQEESRKTSSRVKWGQTRSMEQGVVFGRSMLGYDVKNGHIKINPEGAEIVRFIFHQYVHERKGTTVIARELREAGVKTLRGNVTWRNTVILKILRNEKYCGDLKQKKTITPDYLTHQKKQNHGEEPFVYLRNHHEPIIARALWEEAQREIARRDLDGKHGSGHGNRYPLSGKIKCGVCGRSFVSRTRKRKNGTSYRTWRCITTTVDGKCHLDTAGNEVGCDTGYQLRDEIGIELIRRSVSMLKIDQTAIVENLTRVVLEVLQTTQNHNRQTVKKRNQDLLRLKEKKKSVLDAFFNKTISKEDLTLMNEEYNAQIAILTEKLAEANREKKSLSNAVPERELRQKITGILTGESATDNFYGNLLDHITAYPDKHLEVQLKFLPTKWRYVLE